MAPRAPSNSLSTVRQLSVLGAPSVMAGANTTKGLQLGMKFGNSLQHPHPQDKISPHDLHWKGNDIADQTAAQALQHPRSRHGAILSSPS
eukprot:5438315-Amphidinium_carterae.1